MKALPASLILSGALPFIFATGSLALGKPLHPTVAIDTLLTYGAVILSFLGGIQWGLAVRLVDEAPTSANRLFVLSVLPSLAAWATLLLLNDPKWQMLAQLGILIAVWAVDGLLALQGVIPGWFFKLRTIITSIVAACFIVSLIVLPA
jgi:Protein of unknown function (DUF3429)